jgi:hypothetical protein
VDDSNIPTKVDKPRIIPQPSVPDPLSASFPIPESDHDYSSREPNSKIADDSPALKLLRYFKY